MARITHVLALITSRGPVSFPREFPAFLQTIETGWRFDLCSMVCMDGLTPQGELERLTSLCLPSLAESAEIVPGALPATEVVYLTTYIDSEGQQLDASGGNVYTVDFDLPLPAGAFWSLAMYNETSSFFIANPINRWVINNQVSQLQEAEADADADSVPALFLCQGWAC